MSSNNQIQFPSFRKAFSHTALATFINAGIGIITAIFLARHLGPSSRGDLAIIIASITILSSLSDIYQGGNEISLGRNKFLLPNILIVTLTGAIIFSLLFLLTLSIDKLSEFFLSSQDTHIKLISCIFFLQIILYDGLKRILNARQEFYFLNYVDLLHSFLYLFALSFGIYKLNIDVYGILLILCSANAIRLILVLFKIINILKISRLNSFTIASNWKDEFFEIGKRNFLWSAPYALIQRMSIWQIAALSSNANVGIYRVATTITEIILMIPRAANTITRGKAVSEDGGWKRSLYTSKLVLIFGFMCSIIFAMIGWFLVPFVFGDEYRLVYELGIILILAVSFLGSVFVLEAQIVSKMKFPKNVIYVNYVCLILLFALNSLLIPHGIIYAGLSFLITTLCLFLMYNLIFAKYSSIKKVDIFLISRNDRDFIIEIFRAYLNKNLKK